MNKRTLIRTSLAVLLGLLPGWAAAGSISVAWDAVPGATGYHVYFGTTSRNYGPPVDVGNRLEFLLEGMQDCLDYHIAVKAYDAQGNESAQFSNELVGWSRPRIDAGGVMRTAQGDQLPVVLSGANFENGAELTLQPAQGLNDLSGDPLVRLQSVSVISCGEIRATLDVDGDRGERAMAMGDFSLVFEVRNPDRAFRGSGRLLQVDYNQERSDINRSNTATRDRVDGKDLVWLAYSHGSQEGDATYDPGADLDGDGEVDGDDLALLGTSFGRCWNGTAWTTAACP